MTGDTKQQKPVRAYLDRPEHSGVVTVLAVSGIWAMVRFSGSMPFVADARQLDYDRQVAS